MIKRKFKQYALCLLQDGVDPQNAFEATCDELNLDWADVDKVARAEQWFEEVEMEVA
jgi:hypothetical protein